jgi:hypothetical protein
MTARISIRAFLFLRRKDCGRDSGRRYGRTVDALAVGVIGDDDSFGLMAIPVSRTTARIAAATAEKEKRQYGGFMMRTTGRGESRGKFSC